ncbi:hypothetical protein [Herbaspirillum sp. alder98]|uniref:hypothetical protein n=1 Tax=Herbaspirillum sp. alder98 TaxID=2913096 RepID=UPI001CD873D5|nr:hypothetical protein [Herbaspirillum sp. alder98]MCA1326590.1 hypothetical protein [Herbaspirillum sp. alder98]
MENHASGTQAAALLRHTVQGEPDTYTMERRRQEQQGNANREATTARSDQAIRGERERRAQAENDARFGRPSALTEQYRLPVLETDQFRVVEPDGTEDPLASIDDGLQPVPPAKK